jgi:hypothetical protein
MGMIAIALIPRGRAGYYASPEIIVAGTVADRGLATVVPGVSCCAAYGSIKGGNQ